MTGSVFLVPAESPNFEQTVAAPVDLSTEANRPEQLADVESVRLWGAEAGTRNEQSFAKMESGDLVLFYVDGEYVAVGSVGVAFEDTDGWASETVWDDASLPLVYTVESFQEIAVPGRALNAIFDYAADYRPQGLIRVADGRVNAQLASIRAAVVGYTQRHQ